MSGAISLRPLHVMLRAAITLNFNSHEKLPGNQQNFENLF
jgi:hypothetical protein